MWGGKIVFFRFPPNKTKKTFKKIFGLVVFYNGREGGGGDEGRLGSLKKFIGIIIFFVFFAFCCCFFFFFVY